VTHTSRPREKARKRYGLIRFWDEVDAVNNIKLLNSTMIRGSRVRMCRAKYGKGGLEYCEKLAIKQLWIPRMKQKVRKMWREPSPQANQGEFNHLKQEVTTNLEGEMNENFMEWLNKSVVCESKEPWGLEILSSLS